MLNVSARRCSTGHKGKFGHEFLEFEFRPDGKLRYANNSNYKGDNMIRKEGDEAPSLALSIPSHCEVARCCDDSLL